MSYIYLEIDRAKDNTIDNVEVVRDDAGDIVIFDCIDNIDEWLDSNNNVGYEYTRVEI